MHEPFRSQLVANPGDSFIGLMYADWLSEQGADEESYWRDPRVYAQVWTAVFDGFGPSWGSGNGDGWLTGFGDGNGCSLVFEEGHGFGDGDHWTFGGYGYGTGGGCSEDRESLKEIQEFQENGFYGRFLRIEVLMEGRYILVCDRGFVLVGDASPHPSDWQRAIVDNCSTVRVWGTTRGLGQLALEGPQPETILDYEGDGVDVLRATILRAIPCNETAWKKYPGAFINQTE